ncbi:aspartate beta-hydroxylase domain-containing protein 2 [Elysia marginata]|uniref:Aspartate beta-hydroxylase domain-containing protein 2 n=1 Tax=Elysia marginata TaxID=1093978 RepID=A0AAV4GTF1_9GAST|nr:aspartate beta-hydroxylase domain-containing protein 2 [Elysia marginata]
MDETAAVLLGTAALLMIIVLALEVYRTSCLKREAAAYSGFKSNVCESKHCVRCSKDKDILSDALTRLSFHASQIFGLSDNDVPISAKENAVEIVCADIRTSLKKLKGQGDKASSGEFDAKGSNSEVSNPLVFKYSGIREQKIWHLDDFPGINLLEQNFTQIYLEFVHFYKSPLSETTQLWKRNHTSKGSWEIALLVDQGRRTKVSELCPLTMALIDQIPYFMRGNVFGNASFSVLHPDTEIAAHYGSTNCRIRCHLGLKVPSNAKSCTLWVEGQPQHWEKGKSLFFSDAFLHSVSHKGPPDSGYRVVLMLDLWHPDIAESQRKVLDYAFSS